MRKQDVAVEDGEEPDGGQDVGAETLEPGMGNHPFLRHVGRSFPHDHARQLGRGDPLSSGQQLLLPAGLDTGPDAQISRYTAHTDRTETELSGPVFRQDALEVDNGESPTSAIRQPARNTHAPESPRTRTCPSKRA